MILVIHKKIIKIILPNKKIITHASKPIKNNLLQIILQKTS